MELAPNPYLHITHTATAFTRGRSAQFGMAPQGHQSAQSSHYSSFSASSYTNSRSSQATAGTTVSTLGPPSLATPPILQNGGGPIMTNNVLNTRAGQESSLFQICINLRQRLKCVPGFADILMEEEQEADDDTDPVTLLWRLFRRGYPLMTIYNALQPEKPLEIDESRIRDVKRPQAATAKFLTSCLKDLEFRSEDCFMISDLYGDDTTGFVKVAKAVNRVLDMLVARGLIAADKDDCQASLQVSTNVKRSQREHIIDELVRTERTYVQHLELLQAFKKLVEEKGIIPGDAVHDIFLNLNALLDFQRRFLIRIEQTNAQPEPEQNWGKLFVLYKDAFKVYEPYIANQKRCEEVAMQNFDKLKETGGSPELRQMVESPTVLSSFLLKPFQRLAKYPLLLRELQNKGGLDDERKADVAIGIEAASAVLLRTNAAMDREERKEAVEELRGRVDDWKGHKIETFGELLLHGTFHVLKGETSAPKGSEREYKLYLFEMILLCCKEIDLSKVKNKGKKSDLSGKPKLQLKGRIFMLNVTDTLMMQKPGSYTCQIFWKGDPGIENFVVRFPTEDVMKKWAAQVDSQRRFLKDRARASATAHQTSLHQKSSHQTSTSATEFSYMKEQMANLTNPYAQEDDDGDDNSDEGAQTPGGYGYQNDSNGSDWSLRSRAGTGDSVLPSNGPRAPPPRFPMLGDMSQPPLQLQTRQMAAANGTAMSPPERPGESYFSPSTESPISTRTSSSSVGPFSFNNRQQPNGWHPTLDEHARFTAPAMGRSTPAARGPQRPSLPPNAHSAHAALAQSRLRSASSPDMQNALGRPPQVPDAPVPPFPNHYAYGAEQQNRSQPNLPPQNQTVLPMRAATQSPKVQRDRTQGVAAQPAYYDPRYGAAARGSPSLYPPQADARGQTSTPPMAAAPAMAAPVAPQQQAAETMPTPTQLKVKVHCPSAGSTMTLVVSTNISYQSLKDRIDAKLQRSTNVSLSTGAVKLKYKDEADYVTILSDEDVQEAFETWKEQQGGGLVGAGQLGEIELFCQ